MTIRSKLIYLLVVLCVLVGIVTFVSVYQLNELAAPLKTDIPRAIEELHSVTEMDALVNQVRYYDELLTQSARNYAFTKDVKWKQRYYLYLPAFMDAMRQTETSADSSLRAFFLTVSVENDSLVAMETAALDKVGNGGQKDAIAILESNNYWKCKRTLENALRAYFSRRGLSDDNAYEFSSVTIHSVSAMATNMVRRTYRAGVVLVVMTALFLIIAGMFLYRSIVRPLDSFSRKIRTHSVGGQTIGLAETNDEFGVVAKSFNDMESRLRQNQMQLVQSEKLAAIGQLAAGVAHEINNPIGFISSNSATLKKYVAGFVSLINLSRKGADTETTLLHETKINLGFILQDVDVLLKENEEGLSRVIAIVKNLKDFARIDANQGVMLSNINDGIRNTLLVAANEIKYVADVKLDLGNIPPVPCVLNEINQVFLNVLVNAAQAIRDQKRTSRGCILIRTYEEGENVYCEISDNGPGIPSDVISKMFDPFFTTKDVGKGTGLGLSISYDIIVNKHKGSIIAENSVDGGACFKIRLPLTTEAGRA
jgi:signal transduction histidine kinase